MTDRSMKIHYKPTHMLRVIMPIMTFCLLSLQWYIHTRSRAVITNSCFDSSSDFSARFHLSWKSEYLWFITTDDWVCHRAVVRYSPCLIPITKHRSPNTSIEGVTIINTICAGIISVRINAAVPSATIPSRAPPVVPRLNSIPQYCTCDDKSVSDYRIRI